MRWVQIIINKLPLDPLLIHDGQKFLSKSNFRPITCNVPVSSSQSKIEIVISYLIGEKINSLSEEGRDICYLERENKFATNIGRLFNSKRANYIHVDIFINHNEDGLCVGFLASNYHPLKYVIKGTNNVEVTEIEFSTKSAKELFLSSYATFADLLPISDNTSQDLIDKWINAINSLDDSSELLSTFKKYSCDIPSWISQLCSWGLKVDKCRKYPGCLINAEYYITDDLQPIDYEVNYDVLSPCWTIWMDNTEKIVKTGIIKISNGQDII